MPKKTFFNLPQDKKEYIVNSASAAFAQFPYQDISINTLIEKMEISTGSFYQYFQDKKDLYFYILSLYVESILKESQATGVKLNLLDYEKNKIGTKTFSQTNSKPHYNKIFVENFNLAPHNVKRDWSFDVMIGKQYMDIYDYSFFENKDVPSELYEHKKLIMSLVMAIPMVVSKFTERAEDPEKYHHLYDMCLQIIKRGILSM